MSLINEALKKARQEAARREAQERGQPYPTTPRHLPRRRSGVPLAALAFALGFAALGAGAAWWLLAGRTGPAPAAEVSPAPQTQTPAPQTVAPQTVVPQTSAPQTTAPGGEGMPAASSATAPAETGAAPGRPGTDRIDARPATGSAAAEDNPLASAARARSQRPPGARTEPPEETRPDEETGQAASAGPVSGPVSGPVTGSVSGSAPPSSPPVSPPAPRTPPAAPGSEVFKGTARLADGRVLELEGIASGEAPVAVVNGRVLGLGEGVEGFILVAVENRRAVLRDGDRIVILELP